MNELDTAYIPDSSQHYWAQRVTPHDDPLCSVYETDSASHEAWARFVDNCNAQGLEGLTTIVQEIHLQYGAEFHVTTDAWWFQFPSVEEKTQFLLTWL